MNNYLRMLEESLTKKIDVLTRIQEVSDVQTSILKQESVDLDAFDQCVDEKELFIQELTKLDEGFEVLYDRLRGELAGNKEKYADQIKRLQGLIKEITDRSIKIQTQEQRNQEQVKQVFQKKRLELGQNKKSTKAVINYYQNMSNTDVSKSVFMDQKK